MHPESVPGAAQRDAAISHVARRIPASCDGSCLRVAVDGPDGSGKTTFAEELADGTRRYRPAAHDLATDMVLDPRPRTAVPESVLIVDGLFLHRNEIGNVWDLSVFLEVPFDMTAKRMAHRDGTNPDPDHPGMQHYVEAQRIYFAICSPQQRADILIDNKDLDAPRIVRTTN